jgi:hypothetical protein
VIRIRVLQEAVGRFQLAKTPIVTHFVAAEHKAKQGL